MEAVPKEPTPAVKLEPEICDADVPMSAPDEPAVKAEPEISVLEEEPAAPWRERSVSPVTPRSEALDSLQRVS